MRHLLILLLGFFLVSPFNDALAQKKEQEKSQEKTFEELIKDAEKQEGFFDTYRKDGQLYLALTPDKLDKEFLMKYEIAEGIGSSGLYGGTMLNIFEGHLVALEKHDGKIFLVQKPHRYTAEPGTPAEKAVDLSFSSSVLETASIEATNEDSVMLINVYDWFVSDLSNISRRVQFAVSQNFGQPGRASFDKSRSYLESVKSFPQNTNMTAKLTFRNQEMGAPRTVPDGRYIPVSIHYTLAQLPEDPMTPRIADDRVGYFMTVHKDFSEVDKTFFSRFVNRWRIECEEPAPAGELCEVKEPVVYYIDRTVPEEYRQPLMDGVNAWAEAFEAAGFKDAIHAELLPEDADPEDIRYPTLRWNTSDEPGYGAIGPSIVDPRTGEIMDADILFEANIVRGFKDSWRNMVDPATALETMLGFGEQELGFMEQGGEMSTFGAELADQGSLLRAALLTKGLLEPGEPVPDSYVNEVVKWVTMHEVGHTLGLRHNFRSSADTPLYQLHNEEFTKENGVFGSVMEYPTVNIAPGGEETGHYYNHGVGSYDRWAISFGYTPDADRADEIARHGAQDGHAYGTDQDAGGPGALDPTVNVYDLSGEPMAWGKQRADLLRGLMTEMPDFVMVDNVPYYELTDVYQTLLGQYARALATSIKYIGGQYQYRDHQGDLDARPPFEAIPKAKQEEALDFIVNYAFEADAMALSPELYQKLGANRWFHWGNSTTHNGRIDFPLHEAIVGFQSVLLNQLTHPFRLSRIRDSEAKFGSDRMVGIPELIGSVSDAIWSEVWTAPGSNVSSLRRDLQRAYLDRMVQLLTDAPARTPADARSVIRWQLQDLKQRLESRLTPPTFEFDDYTRAHLEESLARINKALEAGLQLEN